MEFNEVAWFFYWADIIPNIGFIAAILSVVFFILFIFIGIAVWSGFSEYAKAVTHINKHYFSSSQKEEAYKAYKPPSYIPPMIITFVLLIVWLILPAVAVFTPSSDTIYKMGASVIGEQIIQLEGVQEIGGEVGELAKDTIDMLRSHIQDNTVSNRDGQE